MSDRVRPDEEMIANFANPSRRLLDDWAREAIEHERWRAISLLATAMLIVGSVVAYLLESSSGVTIWLYFAGLCMLSTVVNHERYSWSSRAIGDLENVLDHAGIVVSWARNGRWKTTAVTLHFKPSSLQWHRAQEFLAK